MFMSVMVRVGWTFAGVVTFHVPRGLESVQAAPGAGGVETAMSSDDPLMIEAQPESAVPRRATAISEPSLILCPLLVEQFGFTSSAVGCRKRAQFPHRARRRTGRAVRAVAVRNDNASVRTC